MAKKIPLLILLLLAGLASDGRSEKEFPEALEHNPAPVAALKPLF